MSAARGALAIVGALVAAFALALLAGGAVLLWRMPPSGMAPSRRAGLRSSRRGTGPGVPRASLRR